MLVFNGISFSLVLSLFLADRPRLLGHAYEVTSLLFYYSLQIILLFYTHAIQGLCIYTVRTLYFLQCFLTFLIKNSETFVKMLIMNIITNNYHNKQIRLISGSISKIVFWRNKGSCFTSSLFPGIYIELTATNWCNMFFLHAPVILYPLA